jgi:hypothetical protein
MFYISSFSFLFLSFFLFFFSFLRTADDFSSELVGDQGKEGKRERKGE